MNTLFAIYATLAAAATLLFAVAARRCRRRRRDPAPAAMREDYIRRIIAALRDGGTDAAPRIEARGARRKTALSEAICTVVRHTYGTDIALLRTIVVRNRLDRFLLRRAAIARGYRRARLLAVASAVPLAESSATRIARYTRSRNPFVRIYALSAVLAADPSRAIRTLSSHPHPLTPFDINQITALLRRGLLPIASEPLLAARDRNLAMIGLHIVRSFGIETARRHVQSIIAAEDDPAVASEAILTLASLGCPLDTRDIRRRVAAMPSPRRKELCRMLAAEGYSMRTFAALFDARECEYARTLIGSYKKDIVCRPQST